MKRIKKLEANSIYYTKGACCAGSTFFENEKQAKLFLEIANEKLCEFMCINEFFLNKDGWVLIVTTKSKEEIHKAYHSRRATSKKCKPECSFTDTWRMLSEQFRLLLSKFVKQINELTRREGVKVKNSYERYVLESVLEAEFEQEKLRKRGIDLAQRKKKYRGGKHLYGVTKKSEAVSIYLGCSQLTDPKIKRMLGLDCFEMLDLKEGVVRHLIKSTHDLHFT